MPADKATTTIRITAADFADPGFRGGDSQEIPVRLSGFDVPRFVRAYREGDVLSIRFDYLDEEEGVPGHHNGMKILVGKESGKLLALEISGFAGKDVREIAVEISRGIKEQLMEARRENQRLNYRAIDRYLQNNTAALLVPAS